MSLSLIHEFMNSNGEYVLNCTTNPEYDNVVVAYQSDASVSLYDITSCKLLHKVNFRQVPTGLSFHGSTIHIGFESGKVNIYNVNEGLGKCVQELNCHIPITSIDVNSSENLVAFGAEQKDEKGAKGDTDFPFISLFDARNVSSKLVAYTDSHSVGVCSLAFHPRNSDVLLSGGLDGIMNLFNVKEVAEEDALMHSFNAESSVKSVGYVNSPDYIYCATEDSRIGVWDQCADEYILPMNNQTSTTNFPHLVDCFTDLDSIFGLLTNENGGINIGRLVVDEHRDQKHKFVFGSSCKSPHTDIVRCLCYKKDAQILVTGGEDGRLAISKMNFVDDLVKCVKSKKKSHKRKMPY